MRWVGLFIVICALTMEAQEPPQGVVPSLRVHGEAMVSAQPDQAQFDIGIVTQATTAKSASEQNANQANALVHQLHIAFPSAATTTVNFSVNPNYRYPEGSPPTIVGYTANNTVRLLLADISRLQTVVDIAIKSGASSINRLTFSLHNENAARAQALGEAATQARSEAVALAASLKLRLQRLLKVEEEQPVIVSLPREISMEKLQTNDLAPITPGTIDVHADVDLTYEIAPATAQR